ncbi:VPDSG-CTERM sorting domain-containing protein [Pelagicoccus mobilis]|uniref:VPDSG-CTERM sorting domain-containing protein n=1 Tax=Pelagicoccus mobilis TaxID=415221 RepID=A0A934VQP8_9BACT|nr:VPDSG-CTERM sorting domain-containing protein [Pelagicoccus mobilis]MBK1878572.1 VPDSG-CTERM sorting domain-containing protein [Pelagicoccus mobilis]
MKNLILSLAAAGLLTVSASAITKTLTFDEGALAHGKIVTNDFESSHGVVISGLNNDNGLELAVLFNSELTDTRDPDLQRTGYGTDKDAWDGGNLDKDTVLNRLLIVQENNTGTRDGVADLPDDEGTRFSNKYTGVLTFDFVQSIFSFGLDLIDVEGVRTPEDGALKFFSGLNSVTVGFDSLGVTDWGDNKINRVSPILASDHNLTSFDKVEVHLGGSGAVDNITWTVPDSGSTLGLAGLALLGLAAMRRRR